MNLKKLSATVSILLFLGAFPIFLSAQTYTIDMGGSESTCSGSFYDSGGSSGPYTNQENEVMTFCSDNSTCISATFNSVDLGEGDVLYVYDGPNTASPRLDSITGTYNPGSYSSSNGCLTFHFVSNDTIPGPGWDISFSCTTCPLPGGGNNALNPVYSNSQCGLNYVQASKMVATRYSPNPGSGLPVDLDISGLPSPGSCFTIEKAYLYWVESSANTSAAVDVTNPAGNTQNYNVAEIGSGPDKCWGESGTHNFRLDVTSAVDGNGTYTIDMSSSQDLVDGVTLIIIYRDLNATYEGHFFINDGSYICNGCGAIYQDMTQFTACDNSIGGNAFIITADIQDNVGDPNVSRLNGTDQTFGRNFWNFDRINTNVTAGQTTAAFGTNPGGSDCYSWIAMGLYYQTNTCTSCPTDAFSSPISITQTDSSSCSITADATVYPGGGTAPYTYNWSTGATSQSIYNISGGTYSVTVTDANGCTSNDTITISGPAAVTFTADTISATCGNNNGSITLNASGGNGSYQYSIDNGNTFQGTNTFTNLAAGNYDAVVIDGNGCGDTAVVTVPNLVGPNIDSLGITDISCNGLCDGGIDIYASGGNGSLEYSIDGGSTFQASNSFSNLCAGSYDIMVRDTNMCQDTTSTTLQSVSSLNVNVVINDLACYQDGTGEIHLGVAGGNGGYQYSIDSGVTMQPDSFFVGLSAGVYDIYVEDSNGCSYTSTDTVTEPPELVISNLNVDSADCYQSCDGAVSVFPNGGTVSGQYDFYWSNGIGSINEAQPSGICPGSYSVTIEDDNGCSVDTSFTIYDPPQYYVATSSDSATCGKPNGSASVDSVSGSNGTSYSYQWNDPSNQTTATATNLAPGTYNVTIMDGKGCDTTLSVTVPDIPGHTTTISSSTDVSCNGGSDGSATAQVNGGTTPYTYQWDDPSNQTTQTASGLSAGTYQVVVEDSLGCLDSAEVTINEPTQVQVSASPSPDTTICIGGTATLTANASGGTPGYTYHWDQGLGTGQVQNVTPGSNTTYQVYAEDANGCTSSSTSVTVEIHPELDVTALSDDSICPGETVSLSAIGSGGSGQGYTYSWSNGDQGQSTVVAPASTSTYTVILEDDCSTPADTDEVEIVVDPLPDVQFSGSNLSGCSPVEAEFTNDTDPSMVGTQCIWNFGDGMQATNCDSAVHEFTEPGCYDVSLTVRSPDGCVDSATKTNMVCVYPYPVADFEFGPQPTTIQSPTIDFTNMTTGASDYLWDFAGLDSSNKEHPKYSFPSSGEGVYPVCLTATTQYGCVDTVCHDVYIGGEFIVYVPNSFTPNGDGLNDEFGPVIQGYDKTEYSFYVFDRWGEIIFESHSPEKKWNGRVKGTSTMAKSDTYVWKLITKNRFTSERIEKVGHVNVIR